ncbi:TPA: hypothetical protein ACPY3K_003486 [Enterobacter hormaechei subsp. xiangfangensis]|nr:hypothetical protein AZZ90_003166 [Enterobacter hormaechei]
MKSVIYVEHSDEVEVSGNFSNIEAPFLVAKKIKKLTAQKNISNSNSTHYEVEDCGELIAENNVDLKKIKKQRVSLTNTTPSFKVSIVYILVMRAIYGK